MCPFTILTVLLALIAGIAGGLAVIHLINHHPMRALLDGALSLLMVSLAFWNSGTAGATPDGPRGHLITSVAFDDTVPPQPQPVPAPDPWYCVARAAVSRAYTGLGRTRSEARTTALGECQAHHAACIVTWCSDT